MKTHSDIQAPRAGEPDRRQGNIIAKIIGTLALTTFMLLISAGTARALDIGEIVEESPVDLGPVADTVETVTDPVTEIVEPVTEVVEEVTAPVTKAVEPVTEAVEPVAEPVEKVTETVTKAAQPVTNTVTEAVEPVTEVVEEVTAPVTKAVEPLTDTIAGVTETVAETVKKPVAAVSGTVGKVLEEVQQPIQPVLDVIDETIEGTTGVVGRITTPVLDEVDDLIDTPLSPSPNPDGLTDGIGEPPVSNPGPAQGPGPAPSPGNPTSPSGSPGTAPPAEHLPRTTLLPVPSKTSSPVVDPTQTSAENQSSRGPSSMPRPGAATGGLSGADSPVADESPFGGDTSPRALARTTASGSSSSSGSVSGLLAVLVLLGLIAPRLSRWLRPRPVLWRPYALAEALELPG